MKFKIFTVLLIFPLLSFAGGKQVYQDNCEKCHGPSQQGFLGLPLYRSTIANHTDDYIKKTVRNGRPGRVMPGFNLSDKQIAELTLFLRSGLPEPKYSDTPVTGNVNRGKYYYKENCAKCHGNKLQGGKGVGFYLQDDRKVSPPALANQAFLYSASDQMIKRIILNGISNSEMSSYAGKLNNEQVNDIVSYIRSYDKPVDRYDNLISFIYESNENIKNTINRLEKGAAIYGFELHASEHPTRKQDKRKQVVVYFFNPENVTKFLKIDRRLGLVLPMRAIIMENENKEAVIVVENYAYSLKDFRSGAINKAANELNRKISKIILTSISAN